MSPELYSLLLMVFATFFGGLGALLLKIGANSITLQKNLSFIYENRFLFLGLACCGSGLFFNILAYRKSDFSLIFPLTSLNYVWSSFFAFIYLKEELSMNKVYSLLLIIIGIILILS